MQIVRKILVFTGLGLLALMVLLNIWGFVSLGTITPAANPQRDDQANKVVMVFGASGSVGDGLLKAAIQDPEVEKIYAVTRRSTPRIKKGVAAGKVEEKLHQDFTDFSSLSGALAQVNTVLWGLGTSSLNVDDATYTWIHVDFPVAFVKAWLVARTDGPMSFHYVTGVGTDPEGSEHWAREKGRAERELAAMAAPTDLRTFGYRTGFIRPTSEQSNFAHYALEMILRPGSLVISGVDLGGSMLEISARSTELANGSLIDTKDSIAYAKAYREYRGPSPSK